MGKRYGKKDLIITYLEEESDCMKVCIIRNAEAKTNASMKRVISGVLASSNIPLLLTRSRYNDKKGIFKEKYVQNNVEIDNYEINIPTKIGQGIKNIFQLIKYEFSVFNWLRKNKNKFDIVHAFDLDAGLMVYIFSKLSKKKYIYHIADFYVDSRGIKSNFISKIVRGLEYKVIENAEATIICTEQRREQIAGSKPKELYVIHNTPSKVGKVDSSFENPKLTFTYVGGLTRNRFIEHAINLFKQHQSFDLKLAGMGNASDYAKEASSNYENIEYYGMVDYEKALELYGRTDVMFAIYNPEVSNYKYSAPNKVYEAMMYGKPIIVAKGTGVDDIVSKEDMGFVIEYSKEAFEGLLVKIKENPEMLNEKAKNASLAYNKYSWETMERRFVKLYEQVEKTI